MFESLNCHLDYIINSQSCSVSRSTWLASRAVQEFVINRVPVVRTFCRYWRKDLWGKPAHDAKDTNIFLVPCHSWGIIQESILMKTLVSFKWFRSTSGKFLYQSSHMIISSLPWLHHVKEKKSWWLIISYSTGSICCQHSVFLY